MLENLRKITKELEVMNREQTDIAGMWDGNDSGALEEIATDANDKANLLETSIRPLKELIKMLEEELDLPL
jgi:hypothetical protein